MMRLKLLDKMQVICLYEEHLRRDFPPSELKSLGSILRLLELGEYEVIIAHEEGDLVAYALTYCPKEGRVLLLDYMAVVPKRRGHGLGKVMLGMLCAHYKQRADCLMIECERPKAAPDEAQARRRIRFYQQAGASLTSVRIWLFDVEYSILVLPCMEDFDAPAEKDWANQLLGLYRQMLPEELFARNVRLIRG